MAWIRMGGGSTTPAEDIPLYTYGTKDVLWTQSPEARWTSSESGAVNYNSMSIALNTNAMVMTANSIELKPYSKVKVNYYTGSNVGETGTELDISSLTQRGYIGIRRDSSYFYIFVTTTAPTDSGVSGGKIAEFAFRSSGSATYPCKIEVVA